MNIDQMLAEIRRLKAEVERLEREKERLRSWIADQLGAAEADFDLRGRLQRSMAAIEAGKTIPAEQLLTELSDPVAEVVNGCRDGGD